MIKPLKNPHNPIQIIKENIRYLTGNKVPPHEIYHIQRAHHEAINIEKAFQDLIKEEPSLPNIFKK